MGVVAVKPGGDASVQRQFHKATIHHVALRLEFLVMPDLPLAIPLVTDDAFGFFSNRHRCFDGQLSLLR